MSSGALEGILVPRVLKRIIGCPWSARMPRQSRAATGREAVSSKASDATELRGEMR